MNKEQFIQIVELQLGRKRVKMEDRLMEDLGAESMDIVNLAVHIEEQSGVFIPVESMPRLETVAELYQYIQSLR